MKNNTNKDFSCRINLSADSEFHTVDANFSVIKDKDNELLGILLTGKAVKEIKQLKSFYKISRREAEVIQNIVNGLASKEIAEKMNITERTIKMHLTNIYNKLGVDNKVQMMAFLKDFNLLPEQEAEKTVIL